MAAAFRQKKESILQSLNQPDEAYHDLSPKGAVDEGVRHLIQAINGIRGLVTTSSCAGRISVFLEGPHSKQSLQDDTAWSASKGGKGGGKWLFISHDAAELPDSANVDWREKLGMEDGIGREIPVGSSLVHLKFEPMVHIHHLSPCHLQLIHEDIARSSRVS
jgi:tRNA wybutosine-synthesizing protein 3